MRVGADAETQRALWDSRGEIDCSICSLGKAIALNPHLNNPDTPQPSVKDETFIAARITLIYRISLGPVLFSAVNSDPPRSLLVSSKPL